MAFTLRKYLVSVPKLIRYRAADSTKLVRDCLIKSIMAVY